MAGASAVGLCGLDSSQHLKGASESSLVQKMGDNWMRPRCSGLAVLFKAHGTAEGVSESCLMLDAGLEL